VDEPDLAYDLFRGASEIDLGPNMKSSDEGIHAASLGGVWQIVACGFGGLRMVGGKLRIHPKLPRQVTSVTYPLTWKGNPLQVKATAENVTIWNRGTEPVAANVFGKECSIEPMGSGSDLPGFLIESP
jgi:hypothetical glycosyl hydrolase